MYIKKKTIIYFLTILITIFFGLTFLYNLYSSDQLHRDTFAGQVIYKTDNQLIIKNIAGKIHTLDLNSQLQIYQGRKLIDVNSLATNTFVIVEIDTNKIFLLDPQKKPFK